MPIRNSLATTLLLSIFILFSSNYAFSQENEIKKVELNKNVIYGNVGIGEFFVIGAYYDRIFKNNIFWGNDNSHFVKIGIGRSLSSGGSEGDFVLAQYGLLIGTGGQSHHLEMATGFKYYYNESFQPASLPITLSFGWRFQKPGGLHIFKAGLGYPEIIYFGFGWSF